MPLRSKIFLILLSAVVLYAAFDYGIQRLIVFPRFMALERDEAIKDSKRAIQAIQREIFHQTKDKPLSDLTCAGLIITGHGPMLISSRPILRSNNEGPIRGYVMMGRLLGPAQIKALCDQIHVNFRLWPINNEMIASQDRDTLKYITEQTPFFIKERTDGHLGVYTTIADIQGMSALLFRADIARDITEKGTAALWAAVFSLVGSAIVVFLVLHIMLKQTVLDPVRELTSHVVHIGKTDDMSARLAMNRNDEIGTLANEFDCMVDRLHKTRKRLLDQYYYAGMSEMAIGALHDIRNALSPLAGMVYLLQKGLSSLPVGRMQMAVKEITEDNPDQTN